MSEINNLASGNHAEGKMLSFGETIDVLQTVSEGEVKLASIDGQIIASFHGYGSLRYVVVYSTVAMMRQIELFLNEPQSVEDPVSIEILLGLVCSAGLGHQGEQALLIATRHISDNCVESFPQIFRVKPRKFDAVREFPIPAQCKSTRVGHSPGMRRR